MKKINNIEIELVPLYLQKDKFSERVENYRKNIEPIRQKLQKYNELLILLENLKPILPSSPRIVTIDSDDNPSLPR